MADVFAACVGRFYEELADRLVEGATRVFEEAGATVDVHEVPGAFELPLAARYCADSGRYAGVACLGAVIRGETDHYDFVCAEAASGIARVALDTGVPCAFGVLTVDNMEQALARTGGGKRHQGEDAAHAVLRMAALRRELSADARRLARSADLRLPSHGAPQVRTRHGRLRRPARLVARLRRVAGAEAAIAIGPAGPASQAIALGTDGRLLASWTRAERAKRPDRDCARPPGGSSSSPRRSPSSRSTRAAPSSPSTLRATRS